MKSFQTKFHYNKLPMSFWEMILEANNPALVQNARPLAEGIVHSLRNIPPAPRVKCCYRPSAMICESHTHGARSRLFNPFIDRHSCGTTTVQERPNPTSVLANPHQRNIHIRKLQYLNRTRQKFQDYRHSDYRHRRTLYSPHSLFHQCCEKPSATRPLR